MTPSERAFERWWNNNGMNMFLYPTDSIKMACQIGWWAKEEYEERKAKRKKRGKK